MMGSIAVSPSMRLAPHLVEAAVDGLHVLLPDPVDPPGAVRAVRDQPGLLEHPQMLGNGRAADRQRGGDLGDGLGPAGEALEDGPPGRVP